MSWHLAQRATNNKFTMWLLTILNSLCMVCNRRVFYVFFLNANRTLSVLQMQMSLKSIQHGALN